MQKYSGVAIKRDGGPNDHLYSLFSGIILVLNLSKNSFLVSSYLISKTKVFALAHMAPRLKVR